ncbi:diaminopimelate decarboxylase [Zeimonas arvi]|uniref:Diaminopimelate decarboxylase n=1 Tax=Zeimonas arvi TaxID=2498847 RepID=A0A5C8NRF6_9BURK|nr:diaminopimelate decarboxylase [Zeimonas arvi]TXL64290.1 diaminopimelate decarboxylase [Zeimonas arvi]
MEAFHYRQHRLLAEDVALADIAERFGTPTWVYSKAAIASAFDEFAGAAAGRRVLVCYALKANSNLAIIDLLARRGAGFDIVSGGELERVLAAGGDASRIVFSGVGKSRTEMQRALEIGVRCFNVESESELRRLDEVAGALGRRAPVSLRVNPDVDAGTHPYISTGLRENKFGIAHEEALRVYRLAASLPNLDVLGIDCHIGSQITTIEPFLAALDKVLELVDSLAAAGIALKHLDLGGGLGIRYDDETPPSRAALLQAVFERLDRHPRGREFEVLFEFGRSIVGNAGVLLTRVEYLKTNADRHFAIVDAAMNDLMRPSLYEAWHDVLPVDASAPREAAAWDVVGPVCESGDWLARGRRLAIGEGDLLAIMSAGAYGMAMSSNYNTRPRGAEVLVSGDKAVLVRERERVEDLFAHERRLPDPLAG